MDYNNFGGNRASFTGQPQNQLHTAGMPYFQQQGFANKRAPIQQNMQFGYAPPQQTQGFQEEFVGQFPINPNLQMQQAFNQQQNQKLMQQQQRMAQESQKLQNETRKKREFEMQQKRLQEFSRYGGGKKTGAGDLFHLIGSFAEKGGGVSKPSTQKQPLPHPSSGKSIFARPGGSYQAPQKQESPEQHPRAQPNVLHHPGQPQDIQQYPDQLNTQQHSGEPHFQKFPGHQHTVVQPGQSSFQQYTGQPHLQQLPEPPHSQHHPGQTNLQQFPGQHQGQVRAEKLSFQQQPGEQYSQQFSRQHIQQFPGQPNIQQFPGQQQAQDQIKQSSFQQHHGQQHLQQFPGHFHTHKHPGQPSFSQPLPQTYKQQSGFHYQESSFSNQNLNKDISADDEFSDFQEAQPVFSGQGNMFPGQQGSTFSGQSGSAVVTLSSSNAGPGPNLSNQSEIYTQNHPSWKISFIPTSTMDTAFNSNQISQGTNLASGKLTTAQMSPATTTLGCGVIGSRARTDSQSSVSSSSSGGFLSSQGGHFCPTRNLPSLPGMQGHGYIAQNGAGTTLMPESPAQEQVKQVEQHSDVPGHVVEGSGGGDMQEEPEDPIRMLYGVDLPDWCVIGSDLPGVYKDVKDAVTLNGTVDTAKLYTVLLTSELHRDILSQLWSRVNKATPGQLNEMELRIMLGLIALGQTGLKVERLTTEKLATCKSAPIPSFPEDIFKSNESSWSFQREHEKENEEDTSSSLPGIENNFVGWQSQPKNYSKTGEPSDKYSVFRIDNTTSIPQEPTKETATNNWSFLTPKQQADAKSIQTFELQAEQGAKLSSSPEYQSFQGAPSSSEVDNDFGDFQGPVSSLNSIAGVLQQSDMSATSKKERYDSSSELAASLEDFKLKSDTQEQCSIEFSEFESFSSPKSVTTSKTSIPNQGGGRHGCSSHGNSNNGDGTIGKNSNAFSTYPSIKVPPPAESKHSSLNIIKIKSTVKLESKIESEWSESAESPPRIVAEGQEKPIDKYDFLRDLESSTFESPSQSLTNKDDSFGDFEKFESATHPEAEDFGHFQAITTESLSGNHNLSTNQSQGWAFDGLSASTQTSRPINDFGSFENDHFPGCDIKPNDEHSQDDFAAFALGVAKVINGPSFVDQCHQRSSSTTSINFTNSVPLDSTQRYKLLSDEEEDMDKHDNVWGRCLNSCLLTLVTGALAVQKISDPTLKQEVLQSKKGIEYFTALTEVFRVTQRIQFSLLKTEITNEKLKNIFVELNQSWKNISNFLAGSTIKQANVGHQDFSTHHIQSDEDKSMACGVCLLNVNKSSDTDNKISYGGREYHSTCANFWCNRVDSILPKLLPVNSLI